jgi:hypothetical protein
VTPLDFSEPVDPTAFYEILGAGPSPVDVPIYPPKSGRGMR